MGQRFEISEEAVKRVRWVLLGFALFVLGSSGLYILLERIFLPYAWYPYSTNSLLGIMQQESATFKSGNVEQIRSRRWEIGSSTSVSLKFSAKASQSKLEDLWGISTPTLIPIWFEDATGGFTRVQTPLGADPYLFRSVRTLTPIASQKFQVEVKMRSREFVKAQNCRGIWLQENGGSYLSKCFPLTLTPSWQKFRFDWTAPAEARSTSIRVVINDFDGLEYDVRDLVLSQRIGSTWQVLLPLEPTGVVLWLDWKQRDSSEPQPNVALTPDGVWRDYSIQLGLDSDTIVTALLWLERNMSVSIRNVRWEVAESSYKALLTTPFRSSIWFLNPNYAGHSLVLFTLLILYLLPKDATGLLIGISTGLLGIVSIYFTESRAAWGGALVGMPWLFWFQLKPKYRTWLIGGLIAAIILGVIVDGSGFFGRLTLGDRSNVTRQSIWAVATNYIQNHPFGGGDAMIFNKSYADANPMVKETVSHAHNFWLQMGVRFGILGMILSIFLSGLLVIIVKNFDGWRALAFLLPIFLMNFLDYSINYVGVLVPFILGVFFIALSRSYKNHGP
jgi:O-Antigen ligase